MTPAKTLADRFRTQRTDRIRVDGNEVLSVFELRTEVATSIEVTIETCREDVVETLVVESRRTPLRTIRIDPLDPDSPDFDPASRAVIDARPGVSAVFVVEPERRCVVRIYNGWRINETLHAWVGNCGMIVDDLDPPTELSRQYRLWCSDGFGNPTFDDLVVVVTVEPALLDDDWVEDSVSESPDGEDE